MTKTKPKKPKNDAVVYVRLPAELKARLSEVAQRQDISETQAARRALNFWLKVQP